MRSPHLSFTAAFSVLKLIVLVLQPQLYCFHLLLILSSNIISTQQAVIKLENVPAAHYLFSTIQQPAGEQSGAFSYQISQQTRYT